MRVKTISTQYDLMEFHHYIDAIDDGEIISILELLIKTDNLESIENNFSGIFAIETDNQSYVFSNYTVSEYYVDDDCVKVICVK